MSASISLDGTLGALEVGTLLSMFLFGIVTVQAQFYYTTFREDHRSYKSLVLAIWLCEAGHTAGMWYEVYHTTITLYGRPDLMQFRGIGSVTVIGGLITLLAQGFFSARVYRALPFPYRLIGAFCLVVAGARFIGSIVLTYGALTATTITGYKAKWDWLIITLLTVAASIDTIIAVSMVYYLSHQKANALQGASRLIDRLIGFTARTGMLTSITSISLVIVFFASPNTFGWLAVYTCLAKLYSMSVLSALNSRDNLREELSSGSVERVSPGSRNGLGYNPSTAPRNAAHAISIEMKTTVQTTDDHDDSGSSLV